jgi:hypothetical protein
MNQAQSRRHRMRCLLLLTPLLVAGTPSPFPAARSLMLAAAPTRLAFLQLPPEITKGQCVPITVEARDGSGVPSSPGSPLTIKLASSLLGGAFFASNTCQQSAISSVILPENAERVQVWFKASLLGLVTLTASDGVLGLDDALSLPLSVVINPTVRLELRNVPPSAMTGQTLNITVEARDSLGFVATGYSGTLHFTSTDRSAVLPPDYTFTPSVDSGRKTFPVTFQTGGTWDLVVQDVSNANLRASASNIPVRGAAATHLEIANLPLQTFRGRPLSFQVLALDADGNPGSVRGNLAFTSSDSGASLPPEGPLQPSYTVTFDTTGPQTLTVTDTTSSAAAGTVSITVLEAQSRSVEVTPPSTQKPTCERAKLTLEVTDGLTEPVSVSLCRPNNHSAIPVTATHFTDWVMTDQCVTGTFSGQAEVEWVSTERDEVPFMLYGAESSNSVTVSWIPEPKLEPTSFVFLDTSEDIPRLPVDTGEHTLRLQLSDTCPNPKPLALPPGVLSFSASPPLSISTSSNPDIPGQWLVSVTLPECPADATMPLAIWPTLNGRALTKPDGGRFERLVQPKCPPVVKLSISSPGDGEQVEPGGLVEFEVELSNEGQEPVLNGVLMVSAEGLNVLEARVDGDPLTPQDGGFVIPELLPGTKVKVKVKAQATTNLEQQLNVEVWYADAEGTKLTPLQEVGLDRSGLGVDVGCGCHAASLPSQLLPWLALLLAASRPWDRSRRLRRGERIDR